MTILETVYKHEFLISTHPVRLNIDPDKGDSTFLKKMIIKNSLDVIGDDNIDDEDI